MVSRMTFVFFILQDFNSHLDTSLQRYHFQTRKRLFEQKRIKQSIVDEMSAESGRKTAKLGLIVILQAETGLKRRHDKRFQ